LDEAEFKRAVAELDKRGIQVFTHAIGDVPCGWRSTL